MVTKCFKRCDLQEMARIQKKHQKKVSVCFMMSK